MQPFLVVNLNGLINHFPGLIEICRLIKQKLAFQDAINPFCQSILVTVIAICHGTGDTMFSMEILIQRRAVLDATIRVMDQRQLALPLFQRLPEGHGYLLCLQRRMDMVPDDLP